MRDCTKSKDARKFIYRHIPNGPPNFLRERKGHSSDTERAQEPRPGMAALSASAAPAYCSAAAAEGTPRQPQPIRARRRQHRQLERPAQLNTPHCKSASPAAPARNRSETNQHRVSCSRVDRMHVQDSAQRFASPRSQHTTRSTDDSLQLSMRSSVQPSQHPLDRVSPRVGRLCLCSFHMLRCVQPSQHPLDRVSPRVGRLSFVFLPYMLRASVRLCNLTHHRVGTRSLILRIGHRVVFVPPPCCEARRQAFQVELS